MIAKRFLLFLLILSSMCTMTGCLNPLQLNERALVQAIGIDLEDDKVKLTLQVFSPATGGSTNISASAENAKVIEAEGGTVSEAVQNATLVQGKQLFIGHSRVIILGESLAKKGLEQTLSYFSSTATSRQNVNLMVAEGKANDILTAKINQGMLPAETLEKILENTQKNGILKNVRLYEFLGALENKHDSAVLPIIRIKKGEQSAGQEGGGSPAPSGQGEGKPAPAEDKIESVSSIEINGMAVFAEAKMVGKLDNKASRGLLWIRNEVEKTTIVTSTDKYAIAALKIYKSKSTLTPHIQGNDISFTLNIQCEATIGETAIRKGKTVELTDINDLAKAGGNLIQKECEEAFEKAISEYHADVFNFGNIVWRENTDLWKTLRTDWSDAVSDIRLTVSVNMTVDRVGLEFKQKE